MTFKLTIEEFAFFTLQVIYASWIILVKEKARTQQVEYYHEVVTKQISLVLLVAQSIGYLLLRVRRSGTKELFTHVVRFVLTATVSPFAFALVAFLFGAPLASTETIAWGLFVTCLTLLPHGYTIHYQFGEQHLKSVSAQIGCTLFFTWASAVVIPLDWDRAWQQWPVCCTYGALFGSLSTVVINLWLLLFYQPTLEKAKSS